MNKFLSIALMLLSTSVLADETATARGIISPANVVSWIASTFVILLIIFALAYVLKKTKFYKVNTGSLRIENQLFVAPKQKLIVVNAYGKKMLLGVSQNQINYLTELDSFEKTKKAFEQALNESVTQDTVEIEKSDDEHK